MSFPETVTLGWEEVYTESSTKRVPLGTRGVTPDGRCWRYAKAGASALAIGIPCVQPAVTGWSMAQTSDGIGPATGTTISTTMNNFNLGISSRVDATALTADTFTDGFLFTGSSGRLTQDGQFVQILSHYGATASSTCDSIKFTLYPGQHLITAGSCSNLSFGILANPYSGVIEATQGALTIGTVLGVTPIAVTAAYYFWLCTWGLIPVELGVGTTMVGHAVVVCTDTASTGASVASSGISMLNAFMGYLVAGNTTAGSYAVVDLRISP